jgi:HSP20 family protein
MAITRYEPYNDVRSLFDDFFRGFLVQPVPREGAPESVSSRIRVDVAEQGDTYTIHAEIPGVKREDIHVNVDGDLLSITAETKAEKEEKEGERVVYRERTRGKYARSFRLGAEIDLERAGAKYENGVLELTLPKKAAASARQITVQ